MKIILKAFLLMSFISMNAQVAPILDYNWNIEKIVFEEETITANPDNPLNQTNFIYVDAVEDYYRFDLNDCEINIYFDEEEAFFDAFGGGCIISGDGDIILEYFVMFFIQGTQPYDMPGIPIYGPFNYDFRNEGDIIYLDITNSEGDVATFWASTLSSSNFEARDFSIFPNPATNQLNIQSENVAIQHLEIFNLSGKRVLQQTYNATEAIDVSSLAKGLYIIKIETDSGSFTKKLVKE